MWQSLYTILTTREGMYIAYAVPIGYCLMIVGNALLTKRAARVRPGLGDTITLIALLLIALDFVYYLYLFFSHTGKLLPARYLFPKYVGGGVLWVWVAAYLYLTHFAPQRAGAQVKSRYIRLAGMMTGTAILGLMGILIS